MAVPINEVVLEHGHTHEFAYRLWLQPRHRLDGPQSHTMALLSGHFEKKFADP